MALILGDTLLDFGLGYVSSNADRIYLCGAQPTTYLQATNTYALGYKAFGVGAVAGAPQAATGGRKVVTNAVSGGIVTSVGMPLYWAVVDTVNSLLLATGDMSGGVTTDVAKAWTLGAFGITQTNALTTRTYDVATLTWTAAVVAAGGSVSASRKTLVDDLISGLKADGVWSKLDRLWLMAAENEASALLDLKVLGQAAKVNSVPFTVDRGYSNFQRGGYYLNLGYNVSTSAVNFTQNAAHVSIWNLKTDTINDASICDDFNQSTVIYPKFSDGNSYARVNENVANLVVAMSDPRGFLLANRSGINTQELYQNGSSIDTDLTASAAIVNGTLIIVYWDSAAISVGGSLNATEQLALYSRLRTYMTGVGVP